MINPIDQLPIDDSQSSEAADQQSQKDIHSNGLEETAPATATDEPDTDMLKQAFDASEPSYTLATDKGIADKE